MLIAVLDDTFFLIRFDWTGSLKLCTTSVRVASDLALPSVLADGCAEPGPVGTFVT